MSLDERDNEGQTPLYLACSMNQSDVVKLLLKNKRASPTMTDNKGNSCLHATIDSGNEHIAYLLLTVSDQSYDKLIQCKNHSNQSAYDYLRALPPHPSNPHKYDNIRRLFWMVMFAPRPEAFHMCFIGSKITVSLSPFLIYFIGLLIYRFFYTQYGLYIMLLASCLSALFVRGQWHRMVDASKSQNPAYLAAFLTGVIHTMLCFYFEVVPRLSPNDQFIARFISIILCAIFSTIYLQLILRDPGRITADRINFNRDTGAPLNCAEHVRQYRDNGVLGYCTVCELSWCDERVKHCKLCRVCIIDMDHHCLFLMKCIAKNNHRLFVYLIIITLISIAYFLYTSSLVYTPLCYTAFNNPVSLVKCLSQISPWLFTAIIFNIGSFLWGIFMLRYQLMVISQDCTNYYFKNPGQFTRKERCLNVIYFLLFGRLYKRKSCNTQSFCNA